MEQDRPTSGSSTSREAFPTTAATFLHEQLDNGDTGRAAINRHVMAVYARPLRRYYLGSSFGRGDDPDKADEIVEAFFADRLDRDDFFERWKASGRRLRFWLIVAFRHFLYESYRSGRKHQAASLDHAPAQFGNEASEQTYHREVALELVSEAVRRTAEQCRQDEKSIHWDICLSHHMRGRSYRELAEALGIDESRAKVMSRTAGNRFRRTLRELIAWPGATDEDLNNEIHALMEALRP